MASRSNPHKHESPRERQARHHDDVERAAHHLREQQRGHRPTDGAVMQRRALAYSWCDPQELQGLVPDQYLGRWTAPPMGHA